MIARNAAFLDASAWIASLDARQEHHEAALSERNRLVDEGAALVTTNLVLAETHSLLIRHAGPRAGLLFLDRIQADSQYTVLQVDAALQADAVDHWLRPLRDQPFSLCDAASFEVMRRERIGRAFTLDAHFAVAGYEMLPAPRPA